MAKKMIFGWYDSMKAGLLSLLACCLLGSCDGLMHDDLPPCETGAYLHFVYDYNIQRRHVQRPCGWVSCLCLR